MVSKEEVHTVENVYDIKREKNLNFILPKRTYLPGAMEQMEASTAVAIHLHYAERVKEYFHYFSNIPPEIKIIFTTSAPEVKEALEEYQKETNREFQVIEKKNRGRDVSGLLVACREELLKYKYICFIHDKKEKDKNTEKDVKTFIKCLWENTLGSSAYIRNVLYTLETHPSLGVLLPPESFSDNHKFVHINTWDQDYLLMESLAEKLKLHCNLDRQKKPLSLGTVFWARTDALRKLLAWNWDYEDFDEEPLPMDGTISHAIERSFAYVAQDAGYDTGIVMTDEFAGERQDAMQDVMKEAFDMLKAVLGIQTIGEVKKGNQTWQSMLDFSRKTSELYIYGAGAYGQACGKMLGAASICVKGYIVSKKEDGLETVNQLPVKELSDIALDDEKGIIVAVSAPHREEIAQAIHRKDANFQNIFYFLSSDLEIQEE